MFILLIHRSCLDDDEAALLAEKWTGAASIVSTIEYKLRDRRWWLAMRAVFLKTQCNVSEMAQNLDTSHDSATQW